MTHCTTLTCVSLLLTSQLVLATDPVLTWNALLLDAIRIENAAPTLASRNLAILHCAIYDAVNSVERKYQPYRFLLPHEGGALADAAAVGAGHAVLVVLHAPLRARFDEAYWDFVAFAPSTAALTNGLQLGRLIGSLAVGARADDGASLNLPYIPDDAPGQWRRTPPFFRPPLDPQWGLLETFCLPDFEAFMPPPPPELDTPAYAEDLNLVKALGGKASTARTSEQSEIAVFWSDFSYTATPPGHWQEIAAAIAIARGNSLIENARLFALLSLAQADAAIVTWEAKYRYNYWRPVTAIRRAAEDNNPATDSDDAWEAFLPTPPFPEYTSGHSTFSKASATVLANFLGTDGIAFTATSDAVPGVARTFASFSSCADEIGLSRIYGGIHFPSANREGKACGAKIGQFVAENFLLPNASLPLLKIEAKQGNALQLRVHGTIGRSCVVESSNVPGRWEPIHSGPAVVGGFLVSDAISERDQFRFYRVCELY